MDTKRYTRVQKEGMKKQEIDIEQKESGQERKMDIPKNLGNNLIETTKGSVIYNQFNIVAFDKPPRTMVHPNNSADKSLALLPFDYDFKQECYTWVDNDGHEQRLFLINRIDSPASGIILASFDQLTAQKIKALFYQRQVQKTYYAIVSGVPRKLKGTWVNFLLDKKTGGTVRAFESKKGKKAVTEYKVEKTFKKYGVSLLRLSPKTGLTHQIRVQGSLNKTPLIGDKIYGNFDFNKVFRQKTGIKRLMLHAQKIVFHLHNTRQKKIEISCKTPREFLSI
jgi:tRNA pseudouridine65 synthase